MYSLFMLDTSDKDYVYSVFRVTLYGSHHPQKTFICNRIIYFVCVCDTFDKRRTILFCTTCRRTRAAAHGCDAKLKSTLS